MKHIINELKSLEGMRINKIYQLEDFSFLFSLRNKQTLLISASKHSPRMHLSNADYHKPLNPPMFCMLLRKHLENGVITSIDQRGNDRIALISVRKKNELSDTQTKTLIFEALGKDANLVLLGEDKVILDSLNHTHPFSHKRTLVPSAHYEYPFEDRADPHDEKARAKVFVRPLESHKDLMTYFQGISPLFSKEWWHRQTPQTQQDTLETLLEEKTPTIHHAQALSFAPYVCHHLNAEKVSYSSPSAMLDTFYAQKNTIERYKQQAKDLRQFVNRNIKRTTRKIEKLQKELNKAHEASNLEIKGQLLLAYPHEVNEGDASVTLNDFTTGEPLTIALDRKKNAVENAKDYFARYTKQKKAIPHLKREIIRAKNERTYFRLLDEQLTHADLADLEEMREELKNYGYFSKSKKQKRSSKKAKHLSFIDDAGVKIHVGKNNTQNAYITHTLAKRHHTWFHVKDAPGSHVVAEINPDAISETTLRTAANLAAIYSKMRYSSSVAVDYTLVKHIRKIPGQKPCFVTYKHQQTIYIDPDESLPDTLKKI